MLQSKNLVKDSFLIQLTDQGRGMKEKCVNVPQQMMCQNILDMDKAGPLLKTLHQIMHNMMEKEEE